MPTIQDLWSGIPLDQAKICTMRELNQHTAKVIDEINAEDRPALITKHGRFMALIMPLSGVQIESIVLSRGDIGAEMETRAADPHPVTYTTEQLAAEVAKRRGQ